MALPAVFATDDFEIGDLSLDLLARQPISASIFSRGSMCRRLTRLTGLDLPAR